MKEMLQHERGRGLRRRPRSLYIDPIFLAVENGTVDKGQ